METCFTQRLSPGIIPMSHKLRSMKLVPAIISLLLCGCTMLNHPPTDETIREFETALAAKIEQTKTIDELQTYIENKSGTIREISEKNEWEVEIPIFESKESIISTVATFKKASNSLHVTKVITFTLHLDYAR